MLERGLTEGRTDLTVKGGTMNEYVSSLLGGDHRTSGTREDEKEREYLGELSPQE